MAWDISSKQTGSNRPGSNLRDYAAVRWHSAGRRCALSAILGGLNIAYHALDRHIVEGRGDKSALRCLGKNDKRRDLTYGELLGLSNRFANLLRDLCVAEGGAGV